MSIKDSYNNKIVTFDMQDRLEKKINRLTVMMSKLTSNDDRLNKQFKPKIFQSKRRGQIRHLYDKCNYNQRNYQNMYSSSSGDRRISFSGRSQYGQNYRGRPGYEQSHRNDFKRGNFRGNVRMYQNFRRQNKRGGHRGNYRNENYERGRSRSREGQYQGNLRRNERSSSSRSRSGSRMSIYRDRIRCYKCREYDHFAKDCLKTKVENETDQIQQMSNLDAEQTSLKH